MNWIALIVVLFLFAGLHYLNKKGVSFLGRVLLATVLGGIVGLIFKDNTEYVYPIGRIYANLLRAVVTPLLLFSIIKTVISLKDIESLSSIGGRAIGALCMHNIFGSIIAILLSLAFGIGKNAHIEIPANAEINEVPAFTDTIISFFPSNIVAHMAENQVLPVIVFAGLVGVAALLVTDKESIQPFVNFIDAADRVMFQFVGLITKFTPYAVLALITNRIGTMDMASMQSLLIVLLVVFIATLFHSIISTSVINALLAKLNPMPFLKKFFPAWLIGFSTQSSTGAIPANVEAQVKMGVSENVATFAASIGSTFGMPGCAAIWPSIIVIFTINAMNIQYTLLDYAMLVLVCLLVSAGTAGVPGVATIVATSVMTAMGLPVEMVILMTPISAIADMGRTATNVEAAGSAGLIVAAQTDNLNKELYYAN